MCAEGEYGEIKYLSSEKLKRILTSESSTLTVDVVVLAIPDSEEIGKVFLDLGVKHVIAFDIKKIEVFCP